MNNIYLALSFSSLLIVSGCSKNVLTPPGVISFYNGKVSSITSVPSFDVTRTEKVLVSYLSTATIQINKIEISMTGTDWKQVLVGPLEVTITQTHSTVRIGAPVNIPEGQYEGIRIEIEPKVTVTSADGSAQKTLDKLPRVIETNRQPYVPTNGLISFTTSKGTLDAFKVERNSETFIILDLTVSGNDGITFDQFDDWDFYIQVYPTRFIS